jgi:hypothetical protein
MKGNDWESRGESKEEFKKSIGLPGTIWIHEHHCHHDLMRSNIIPISNCEYSDILNYVTKNNEHLQVTWAIHPFNKSQNTKGDTYNTHSYETVCKEFGYEIPKKIHEWNEYSSDELWELVQSWDWEGNIDMGNSTTIIAELVANDNIFDRWYKHLFSGKIKYSEWIHVITDGERKYPWKWR